MLSGFKSELQFSGVYTYDTSARDQAVQEYENLIREIEVKNESSGPGARARELEYRYVVEPLELRPTLPTALELMRLEDQLRNANSSEDRIDAMRGYQQYEEFLGRHYSELAKLVSKELIATIPAK